MHALYELKDMLCKELEEIGEKGELTAGTLETVEKLSSSVKNLCKIIDYCEDEEYSGDMMGGMGGSYARGGNRAGGGRGSRGSRGGRTGANQYGSYARGYSRDGDMISKLEDLMGEARDDKTRREIERLVEKMRSM